MTSHIGFPQRVRNPDVRANVAIYSNSELCYYEVVDKDAMLEIFFPSISQSHIVQLMWNLE